ncbi:hypothetical protein J2T13_003639 [Paenibacillus sp. DS2015]|uniref:hypothetical protein n=1 Tax=Paenibacillus sp. DS2015 TaxID=3373917 RepID=UPI003D231027
MDVQSFARIIKDAGIKFDQATFDPKGDPELFWVRTGVTKALQAVSILLGDHEHTSESWDKHLVDQIITTIRLNTEQVPQPGFEEPDA